MSSFERENRGVIAALTGIAAAAYFAKDSASDLIGVRILNGTHVVSFSVWLGASFWTTFVGGIVLFKSLPRHTFGLVQSKLFPRYFQLSAISLGLVTATSLLSPTFSIDKVHAIVLGVANVSVLLNLLYFEPVTTAVMFERHVIERKYGEGNGIGQTTPTSEEAKKDPQLAALSKRFGMLHGVSSLLNLFAVCGGIFHAWYLSGLLH